MRRFSVEGKINEEGEEKGRVCLRLVGGGDGSEGCKGELQSTFTRRIINPECDRNMMKKVKQSDEFPASMGMHGSLAIRFFLTFWDAIAFDYGRQSEETVGQMAFFV